MKSTLLLLFVAVFFTLNCNAAAPQKKEGKKEKTALNTLSAAEKAQGWLLLFDGKTNEGWRGYNKTTFPAAWTVENGALRLKGSGNGEAGAVDGGDLVYAKEKFSNFNLKIEWKISEGGNSGIFYLAQEIPGKEIWRTAPEFQVLDNDRHPDALLGKDGNRKAGSLYDLIPAKPQNTKPAGEWNSVEIISYQGTIVHKQNGETVLEYHLWTPEWNELVKNSKFPTYNPDWANVAKEGFIGLQDHGNDVWYRNIKIRKL
ncbi:MAG TPA: DUF1080 domain-containing protein [Prolixibacteraceae bacterium]|jgi:hypothetical protein